MYCHKTGSIWDSHLSQWGEDFASEIHSRQGTSKPCIVQAAGHRNATCLHGLGVLSWSSEFWFVLQWAWWDWQHCHWPYLYVSISSVETLCLTKPHASGLCPGTFLVWEYSFCMHFCLEVPGRCFLMFFWSLREVQGDLNGRELMRRESVRLRAKLWYLHLGGLNSFLGYSDILPKSPWCRIWRTWTCES